MSDETRAAWDIHRRAVQAAQSARKPLPDALASRLRAIPREQSSVDRPANLRADACPSAVQLVRAARRAQPRDAEADVSSRDVHAHLLVCAPCRRLAAALEAGFAARRRPRALDRRLRRIVGHRAPHRAFAWAFDLRVASAAAALIGVLLVPIAEPTAALARQAGSAVGTPIKDLAATPRGPVGSTLRGATAPLTASADRSVERLRRLASAHADSWRTFATRTRAVWHELRMIAADAANDPSGSGEQDDDD